MRGVMKGPRSRDSEREGTPHKHKYRRKRGKGKPTETQGKVLGYTVGVTDILILCTVSCTHL